MKMKQCLLAVILSMILLMSLSSFSYASLPNLFFIECELELKNGSKVTGFLEAWDDGCEYSKEKKAYIIDDYGGEGKLLLTDDYLLKRYLHKEDGPSSIEIYKEIHELHYLPKLKSKINDDTYIPRISSVGIRDSDVIEINNNMIRKAHVIKCIILKDEVFADPLILNKRELEALEKPAKAFFSVENYPDGVVSLISYNPDWDTPDKLKSLLKKFINTKKFVKLDYGEDPNAWWNPIYKEEDEKEFRQQYLPKDIILLIYHVQD